MVTKIYSFIFYDLSKWSNVIFITIITLFGIYGNLTSIKIFTSPSYKNVKPLKYYLILISVSDLSVLITHYVDFTFRSWVNLLGVYSTKFNFVDKYDFFCKIVPYLRNVFKTLSVYVLLFMTLHRFILLYFPMTKSRLNSVKFNRKLLIFLTTASFLANFGNLFINGIVLHHANAEYFCSIQTKYIKLNLYSEIFFVLFTILIPSLFFLIFSLVLFKKIVGLKKSNKFYFEKAHSNPHQSNMLTVIINNKNESNCFKLNSSQILIPSKNGRSSLSKKHKSGFSIRTTYMMVLLSKWFVLLHLPYFVAWLVFYVHLNFRSFEKFSSLNQSDIFANRTIYLKSFLNFAEILFSFNYSINFLLYLINGPLFRKIYREMNVRFFVKLWGIF